MGKKGSLTKFKVWQKTKQAILSGMDRNIIEPERAKKILEFIKSTLKAVATMEDLGMYLGMLKERFPELKTTIDGLAMEEEEKLDSAVSIVVDKLMNGDSFETAEKLIEKLESIDNTEEKIEIIKKSQPQIFEETYKAIFKDDSPPN